MENFCYNTFKTIKAGVLMKLILSLLMILIAALCCGCNSTATREVKAGNLAAAPKPDPADEILKDMSLTEKIGQMVMIGVYGNAVNDDIRFLLAQYHMGGIIFFDRNMDSKAQVRNFAEHLNFVADEKVPLFIALDEEGGIVSRMKHDLPAPPSQEEIGYGGNPADAFTYANLTAQNLKDIGMNLNFAPVADVGTQDTRSFSNDAKTVAEFVSNAAKGYEDAGIFYCLKHFPGIGRGTVDSHQDVSTIDASKEILNATDLIPFKKIIKEQNNSKFMIMVSHLKYSALDAENSATLSPAVITDLLRNDLGFTGVVITDDLDMGAISNHLEASEVGVRAVLAGADILLSCHEYDTQQKIYLGILNAVESGEISQERIDESVRRILKMKLELTNQNK